MRDFEIFSFLGDMENCGMNEMENSIINKAHTQLSASICICMKHIICINICTYIHYYYNECNVQYEF